MLEVARALPQWFTREGLEEMAQDFELHDGFVATEGDEIVGFITYETLAVDLAELSWMGVRPEYQRRGIGKRLLQLAQERLIAQRIKILQAATAADSVLYEPYARTRAFYQANGFRDYRVDRGYFPNGDDRLLLQKEL
ncbi:MAG: GNAT family N-acetyltransferase [Candidatus Acetothermia bacterium]|jgi:ribosomal protein S18 acetylase RimI-like enzyme|nr:GNAT family N-acetyltransferase [Candidatus Acetothermia bacterium]MDH7504929.1 GNAT family N-acetyltransferase [Candidatus Acetothermia bacterium]